jgi:hypothetical protein
MPSKKSHDTAAAKAKKQKIVLGIAGLAFLALCAIQGPKLMKGSSSTPPAPAAAESAAAPDTSGAPVTPAPAATGSATVVKATTRRASAVLAGVTIEGGGTPAAGAAQLVSFSLFEAKDPFVQQGSTETSGTTETTATPTLSDTEPTPSTGTSGSTSSSTSSSSSGGSAPSTTEAPQAAPATTNVTIEMNGKSYPLEVKESFPKAEPLFKVASAKPKLVRIGVAGGSFADAKTLPLRLGKQVVLVNQATGARYVLKLVYTGDVPEQTESFTQAGK